MFKLFKLTTVQGTMVMSYKASSYALKKKKKKKQAQFKDIIIIIVSAMVVMIKLNLAYRYIGVNLTPYRTR